MIVPHVAIASIRWLALTAGAIAVTRLGPSRSSDACVIVPSIGHEDLSAHPGIVHLARRIAATRRVAVVQHWGTDQSDGSVDDEQVVDLWVDGVRRTIDDLRAEGASRIDVVAVRLGVLLTHFAVLASQIDGLVMWSPTVSGRRFTRELKVMAAAGSTPVSSTVTNVGGFAYPSSLLDDLARRTADPTALTAAGSRPRVLVMDHAIRPCDPAYLDALRGTGLAVEHQAAPDIATWIDRSIDDARIPERSIDTIVRWLETPDTVTSTVAEAAREPDGPPPGRTADDGSNRPSESFVALGTRRLSGVRSQPLASPRPVGLLLDSTLGPGRSFVELARREAARGRPVLRYDFAGHRWSPPRVPHRVSDQFDSHDLDDALEVIATWRSTGVDRIVAVGFCAGSTLLLRAAARGALDGVIAINPPLQDLGVDPDVPRADPDAAGSVARRRLAQAARFGRGALTTHRTLHDTLRHGTQLLFVFDANDSGHRFWNAVLSRRMRPAVRDGRITVEAHPGLGHNLEGVHPDEGLGLVHSWIERFDQGRTIPVVS